MTGPFHQERLGSKLFAKAENLSMNLVGDDVRRL
jgi:hypothetical protein